ncbi:type II and III secretion system protein [Burkholderia dolosa AU0158]|nr:type II and III secretion system protein [Burkholderia dolosa AU0158]
MKNTLLAFAIAVWTMTFASLAGASGTIELAVGAQRQISAGRALQRVAVGDPAVADVLIMKGSRSGSVLLVAKAPGATNVMLWERGRDEPTVWNVEVVDAAAQAVLDGSTPRVNAYGGTAVLRGTAASLDAHERAAAVAKNTAAKGAIVDRSTVADLMYFLLTFFGRIRDMEQRKEEEKSFWHTTAFTFYFLSPTILFFFN